MTLLKCHTAKVVRKHKLLIVLVLTVFVLYVGYTLDKDLTKKGSEFIIAAIIERLVEILTTSGSEA